MTPTSRHNPLMRTHWSIDPAQGPALAAADAAKQSRLYEAIGSGEDPRFALSFETYRGRDSDLYVTARESDLMPVLTHLAGEHGTDGRYTVHTLTQEDADRIERLYGESNATVEDDLRWIVGGASRETTGPWPTPPREESGPGALTEYTFALGHPDHEPGLYISWVVRAGTEREAVNLSRRQFADDYEGAGITLDPMEFAPETSEPGVFGFVVRLDAWRITASNIIERFTPPPGYGG